MAGFRNVNKTAWAPTAFRPIKPWSSPRAVDSRPANRLLTSLQRSSSFITHHSSPAQPVTVVARFEIRHSQFLDPSGKPVQPLPDFAKDPKELIALYRWMVLMRTYDAKAIALQRTGQLGTFASLLGKEAVEAGIGSAMARDDVLLMTYRENGVQLMRGV